jgi:hypothetical protein
MKHTRAPTMDAERLCALRCTAATSDVPAMTIESQIIEFLCRRRGGLFCHPCIRRNLTLPDIPEIETAVRAIGRAATFRHGDDECSDCRGTRPVVGAK